MQALWQIYFATYKCIGAPASITKRQPGLCELPASWAVSCSTWPQKTPKRQEEKQTNQQQITNKQQQATTNNGSATMQPATNN